MKVLNPEQAKRRTLLLRLNILIGFIVFIASVVLLISGEYSSLAERKEADEFYNVIAIGSLLYMAFIWFACNISRPFWKAGSSKED
ncbi:MAG: hypothetical protein OEY36_03225 [Gammaproteobacteria bacterium]|nr:hypothetical protein [Gammaproteobacteria bacterium]